MGKGLRTFLIILCIAGFGTFGFAAYKVYDSGFSRSDKPVSAVPESSVSESSVSEQSGTIAFDSTPATPPQQASSEVHTTSGGPTYRIDKESFHTYTNESGDWLQASFRLTNTSNYSLQLYNAFCDLRDAAGNPISNWKTMGAVPSVVNPGESAWYSIYLDEDVTSISHVTPRLMAEPSINYQYDIVHYPVSNVRLIEEDGLPVAYGTIENNTDIVLDSKSNSMPYIYVFLYDQDGFLLGKLGVNTLHLTPGEKGDFKAELVLHPTGNEKKITIDYSSIANYEAIAYQLFERS